MKPNIFRMLVRELGLARLNPTYAFSQLKLETVGTAYIHISMHLGDRKS
jgi:hypothetical protein